MNNLIKKVAISIPVLLITFMYLGISVNAQEEATESSETIRDRVQEKLDRAMNQPKAYIGSITDITDSTIQINNLEGEIQQIVTLPDETSFYNTGEEEEIEYSDVAIGDQIVSIGYVDENDILNAVRILITSSNEEEERAIYYGEVKSVEGKTILIEDPEQGEVELLFPSRWKGPEIVEFTEGQKVGAVSINDEGELTIRTIEIVSDSASSDTAEQE